MLSQGPNIEVLDVAVFGPLLSERSCDFIIVRLSDGSMFVINFSLKTALEPFLGFFACSQVTIMAKK